MPYYPQGNDGQAGTTTFKGVVELATDAESVTGTLDTVVCTPGNLTARLAAPGGIGGTTAAVGAFTTISATGAITSTLADGSAPLVITSTTKVANLNVDKLDGNDWATPAAIGSGTAAAGAFTTVKGSGIAQFGVAAGIGQVNITPASGIYGLYINQDNANTGMLIDQDGAAVALDISCRWGMRITQDIVDGYGMLITRNLGATDDSYPLIEFGSANAGAVQPTLFIDHNGTGGTAGYGLHVDSENAAAPGAYIQSANTIGLKIDSGMAFSNAAEGATGALNIKTAREVHTLASAATSDTTLNIPSGAMLLGASFTVNTAVTSSAASNTWDADFITGSTTALVAAGASGAQNTKANALIVPEIASDTTNIQFDAAGAETFTGGVIEIIVYYIDQTSLADV